MSIPTSLHAARELIRVKASRNEFVTLVHEATNEDPWGPTGPQMENVCRVFPRGSLDIMEEIRLRLKHREKSWRSCYKSLLLLDYLARNVAESALPEICSVVPTLRVISQSFYYTGRKGVDHGLSVRERAKKLLDILSDGVALREERDKAALTHSKLTAGSSQCGGGGGGGYANRYQSYPPGYTGGGGAPAAPTGSYDPYIPRRSPVTRTREEQERLDMELAARMQREEENRSGRTVAEAERMFHQRAHNSSVVSQAAHDADMELARRLQEEEEYRARRNSDASASAPTPESPKAEPAKPPPPDVFDDLFAPAPLPGPALASAAGQPEWATATTAPPPQMQAQGPTDPFDTFLNSCMQQQQQIPPMQQQQQQIPPMQQQQQQIPPMQQQQQISPMQQQQQQIPPMQQGQPTFFGAAQFQPAVASGAMWFGGTPQTQPMMMPDQQQQQFSGWSAGLPPPQFAAPPQSNQWGTVAQSSNFNFPSSAMHQVQPAPMPPGAVNQNSGPFSGFMSANTGFVGTGSAIEQPLANAFGGSSQNSKSLDALMAERRAAQ